MKPEGPLELIAKRDTEQLMNVALGRLTADLVITNAAIVNVYTAEIQQGMTIDAVALAELRYSVRRQ